MSSILKSELAFDDMVLNRSEEQGEKAQEESLGGLGEFLRKTKFSK